MIIFSLTGFAQSGQKWAADGNAAGNSDFIGTTNNVSLKFQVNNALALTIEPGGKVKINSLAGGEGIVRYDTYGTLSPIPFNGDQNMVLLGNGHWGTVPIPENYWKIDPTTNHLYTLTPGNVGIGTQTPVMKLDVNGDAVVRGYLYVNNGVIIGKKIDSKSIYSDTLEVSERIRANELTSKTMYSDSLDALKVNVENLAASKEARIGSGLVLDGIYSQIFSNSGLIDFKNTNLTTTGYITANRINATAFHVDTFSVSNVNTTGDIITTGNIYARRIYAEKSVSVGNFTFKNGGTVIGPGKDTIKTENRMAIVSEANSIRMVSDTVIMSDRVAIGREYAEYSLDVAGNARFQDKLIVEGGLIIGKEYQGEKGEIDSLVSKEASIDTVRSENIRATEVNASDRINIGSGNTIRIDGLNSQITSTTGKIDFGSNELRTSGPITGGAFNVGTGNFGTLNVTNKINIGANTLILENDPNGFRNSIYTHGTAQNEDLFIQSTDLNDNNTIINNNNAGKVGIGTNNPVEKLHVRGPNNYFVGAKFENDEGYLKTGFNGAHGIIDSDREIFLNWYSGKDVVVGGGNQHWNMADGGAFATLHNTSLAKINGKVTFFDNPLNPENKFEISKEISSIEYRGIRVPENIGQIDFFIREGSPYAGFNFISKQQSGNEKVVLTIRDTGNVGIGIHDPMQKLEIGLGGSLSFRPENNTFGKIYFKAGATSLAGKIESFSNGIGIYGDNTTSGLTVYTNGNILIGPTGSMSPMTILNIRNKVFFEKKDANGTKMNEILVFENDNNLFVIKKYLSAQEAISLFEFRNDGELFVRNKIFCKEMEVMLDVLPDYVFEKDYYLRPISEVKRFIEENKHLPEVPNQKEVSENGMNVGEFNAILLKKIEELTLYIIKQDEEIEKLKKEVY